MKSGTLIDTAIFIISSLPSSVLKFLGYGKLNVRAIIVAYEEIKTLWSSSFGFISVISLGGLFGNFQKGYPSLVFMVNGYVWSNCLISFLKYL